MSNTIDMLMLHDRIFWYRVLDNPEDPYDYVTMQLRSAFEDYEWKQIHDPDTGNIAQRFRKLTRDEYFARSKDRPDDYVHSRYMNQRWISWLNGARALNLIRQTNRYGRDNDELI